MDSYERSRVLKIATHYGVSLLELGPEKGESISNWFANIYGSYMKWSCCNDASQAIDKAIYSRDLCNNDL